MTEEYQDYGFTNAEGAHTSADLREPVRSLIPEGAAVLDAGCGNGAFAGRLAAAGYSVMDGRFTAQWDGGHIKFWSRRTLSALLEEVGFGRLEFRGAGRLPYLWNSMILSARRP